MRQGKVMPTTKTNLLLLSLFVACGESSSQHDRSDDPASADRDLSHLGGGGATSRHAPKPGGQRPGRDTQPRGDLPSRPDSGATRPDVGVGRPDLGRPSRPDAGNPTPGPDAGPGPGPDPDLGTTPDSGKTPGPGPSTGWTTFAPDANSRVVHVSSSAGDDSHDGSSPDQAVRTLNRGAQLVRDGQFDFLLLKRGDTWRNESLGSFKGGRDATHPLVVSYYGESGPRPRIETGAFINHNGATRSNFALIGLEITDHTMNPDDPGYTGNPRHSGLRLLGGGSNILIEDCRFRFAGITIQDWSGGVYRNVTIRRNMILDVWAPGTSTSNSQRPSGIFAKAVEGLVIEENVLDHNGWNEDVSGAGANAYNHNVYITAHTQGNGVVFRRNIVTRGSSHGVHGRPGGLYEDNLFAENSISLQMGYDQAAALAAGTFAHAINNVILAGKRMDPNKSTQPQTSAVWGLHVTNIGAADVVLRNNIVANRRDSGTNVGINELGGVTYDGNIQYAWGRGDMNDSSWPEPTRTVGSYHGSLGRTASLEAFLEVVRNRPLGSWPATYTASAVNDYVRAGFGR